MDKLTMVLAAGLFAVGCLWVGYLEGRSRGTELLRQYQAQAQAEALHAAREAEKQLERYIAIGGEYYEKYVEARDREPTVITERVRIPVEVPAACGDPADTDPAGTVGAGTTVEANARLPDRTVAELARFAARAENELEQCRAALGSVIKKIEVFNESTM